VALDKGSKNLENVKVIQDKRKSVYKFGAFTFLVVIILVVGAIRPSIGTIITIWQEIQTKKEQVEVLDDKLDKHGELFEQYTSIEDDRERLRLLFPADQNFSLFLANIEELAKKHGFKLNSINFEEGDDTSVLNTVALINWSSTISVTGPESEMIPLMKDIETLPMYPIINRISYSSEENEEGDITMSMTILLYRVDDPLFYEE
jgi:Tfp pilus assembly protein PilO